MGTGKPSGTQAATREMMMVGKETEFVEVISGLHLYGRRCIECSDFEVMECFSCHDGHGFLAPSGIHSSCSSVMLSPISAPIRLPAAPFWLRAAGSAASRSFVALDARLVSPPAPRSRCVSVYLRHGESRLRPRVSQRGTLSGSHSPSRCTQTSATSRCASPTLIDSSPPQLRNGLTV